MNTSKSSVRSIALKHVSVFAFLFAIFCMLGSNASTARADNCSSCSQVASSPQSNLRLRVKTSKIPKNGHRKIGRVDNLNIIGVFKNGNLVDYYLKNRKSGKKIFGSTQVKTLKIFSKCFKKKKFGVKLKICITIDVSIF